MSRKFTLSLLLLFILSYFSSYSQKTSIKWGKLGDSEHMLRALAVGENSDIIRCSYQYVNLNTKKKTKKAFALSRYNSDAVEQSSILFEPDEKLSHFKALWYIKGSLFLYSHSYNWRSNLTSFYCQKIDPKTLAKIGDPYLLGTFPAKDEYIQHELGLKVSTDSTKVLLTGLSPSEGKKDRHWYMRVFDSNMNKLWENTITIRYAILNYLVTNDGKVVMIVKDYYKRNTSKESIKENGNLVPAYKVKLLVFDKEQKEANEIDIDLKNQYLHSASVFDGLDKDIQVFGLFSKDWYSSLTGFFINNINVSTNENTTRILGVFPQDMLKQLKIDLQGRDKGNDPGIDRSFVLASTVKRDDGSIDYILENQDHNYFGESSTVTKGVRYYTGSNIKFCNNDNILDINIKPNKEIIITRVPKMQRELHKTNYGMFQALPYKDKLVLFYNDERNNLELDLSKPHEAIKKFNTSVLVMATIDSSGKVYRKAVADNKGMDFIIAVKLCKRLNDETIILLGLNEGGIFGKDKMAVGTLKLE